MKKCLGGNDPKNDLKTCQLSVQELVQQWFYNDATINENGPQKIFCSARFSGSFLIIFGILANRAQDGAEMAQRVAKMLPRVSQMVPKKAQMTQDSAKEA